MIPLSVVKAATAGVLAPVRLWIDKGLEEGGAAAAISRATPSLPSKLTTRTVVKLSDGGARTEFRWDSPSGLLLSTRC